MNKTTDLIQKYYAAFNAKRFQEMLGYLSEDIIHDTNQGERTVGKAAFTEFLGEMDAFYDEHLDNIVIMSNADGSRAASGMLL